MKVDQFVRCSDFPCTDTNRSSYLVPGMDLDPARVRRLAQLHQRCGVDPGIGIALVRFESAQVQNTAPYQRGQQLQPVQGYGGDVNRLVIYNRSGRKLLLLAGEMVVGGKQDRIVQKDRIVPPSDHPYDLDVFCVEHSSSADSRKTRLISRSHEASS